MTTSLDIFCREQPFAAEVSGADAKPPKTCLTQVKIVLTISTKPPLKVIKNTEYFQTRNWPMVIKRFFFYLKFDIKALNNTHPPSSGVLSPSFHRPIQHFLSYRLIPHPSAHPSPLIFPIHFPKIRRHSFFSLNNLLYPPPVTHAAAFIPMHTA